MKTVLLLIPFLWFLSWADSLKGQEVSSSKKTGDVIIPTPAPIPIPYPVTLAKPSRGKGHRTISAQIDQLVKAALDTINIPGLTIAVSKQGKLVYNKGLGYANYEDKKAMQPYHRSIIGSVSKVLTALGIMKLTEEKASFDINKKVYGSQGSFGTNWLDYELAKSKGIARFHPIVGMAISKSDRTYAWYSNGTISSGRTYDLDYHTAPQTYTCPPGQNPNTIRAIAISNGNRTYTWYDDGSRSIGTTTDLDHYAYYEYDDEEEEPAYQVASGKSIHNIVGIGINKANRVYVWYDDGTRSIGNTSDFDKYEEAKTFSLPSGKSAYDIIDMGIAKSDDHVYTWFSKIGFLSRKVSSGTSRDLDQYKALYTYTIPPVGSSAYTAWYSKMQVKHLLSHTSGLQRDCRPSDAAGMFGVNTQSLTNKQIHEHFLRTRKLGYEPGTSASYSNQGMMVLSEIIASESGMSYVDYMQEKIFKPLGIKRIVSIGASGDEYDAEPHYEDDGEIKTASVKTNKLLGFDGAGNWKSSARNLVRIMVATDRLGNYPDILKSATLDTMETRPFSGTSNFALGWSHSSRDGKRRLSHNGLIRRGSNGGGTAYMVKFEDGYFSSDSTDLSNINIALCANIGKNYTGILRSLANEIALLVGKANIPSSYDLFNDQSLQSPSPSGKFTGVWRESNTKDYLWVGENWSCFVNKNREYVKQGLRLQDVETHVADGKRVYSGVWKKSNKKWALYLYSNWDSFVDKWKELADKDYRLIDIETYVSGGQRWYLGVWESGTDGYALYQYNNWNSFVSKWSELGKQGLRLTNIETFVSGGKRWYLGVWRQGNDGYALYQIKGWTNFTDKWKELADENVRLVDMETFVSNGNHWYLGVWRGGNDGYALWHNTSWSSFSDMRDTQTAKGRALVDFEVITNGNSARSTTADAQLAEPSAFARLVNSQTEAASEVEAPSFSVYPNPTPDIFTVSIEEEDIVAGAENRLLVYNAQGELMLDQVITQATELSVNLRGQKPGVYLVKLIKPNQQVSMQRVLRK